MPQLLKNTKNHQTQETIKKQFEQITDKNSFLTLSKNNNKSKEIDLLIFLCAGLYHFSLNLHYNNKDNEMYHDVIRLIKTIKDNDTKETYKKLLEMILITLAYNKINNPEILQKYIQNKIQCGTLTSTYNQLDNKLIDFLSSNNYITNLYVLIQNTILKDKEKNCTPIR